ncbi:MAG: MarR family winged helix-turn-helix transcriptional regulator [Candidatus Sericytochromatia bacterium]
MPPLDTRYPVAQDESMLPVMRALNAATQQSERVLNRFLETYALTPSQFDVLAVLGDTEGMSCKDLSRQSLITGGTLTPVLDRLEAKGLVRRCKGTQDSRQTIAALTPEGQALYEKVFLPFVDHARKQLSALTDAEQAELVRLLNKVHAAFE